MCLCVRERERECVCVCWVISVNTQNCLLGNFSRVIPSVVSAKASDAAFLWRRDLCDYAFLIKTSKPDRIVAVKLQTEEELPL